jgi:flavin reductase (DIM6/NTAB) family NADH-FMN oxidoreductase RutF
MALSEDWGINLITIMSYQTFDSHLCSSSENYHRMTSLIVPRPIAWVSTLSLEGVVNLAPFSFFNGVSSNPLCLSIAVARKEDGSKKDTLVNIEATGEFVVNASHEWMAEAINQSSAPLPPEESEVDHLHLSTIPSLHVKPPRVKESLAHFECRTEKLVEIGDGASGSSTLIIGRILAIHIDDSLMTEKGRVDPLKLKPISRLGGMTWSKLGELVNLIRP